MVPATFFCSHASFEIPGFFPQTQLKSVYSDTHYSRMDAESRPQNFRTTGSEVIIQRAGMFILRGEAKTPRIEPHQVSSGEITSSAADITVQMFPTHVAASAVISAKLEKFAKKDSINGWGMWQGGSEDQGFS